MGGRNLAILGIAVILGIVAVLLANAYFSGVEERQERVAEDQQLVRIVVATQPLEFGSELTADNLRLQNWPAASVPEGAFTEIEAATRDGRVALRPIVVGEPVLADKVSGLDGRAVLSALLPEDMRAISISIAAVTGVSGFVRPGDIVDIILTRQIPGDGAGSDDMMTDVIMESVPVLAIDQVASTDATQPALGTTAVVQVDQFDAQKLILAQRLGVLSLALRNVEDQMPGPAVTVTKRDLGDPSFYIAAPQQGSSSQEASFGPSSGGSGGSASAPAPSGPVMSIYRGTEGTDYAVGRLGRN